MGVLNNIINFIGSMHISALIIISIILSIFTVALVFILILRVKYSQLRRELDRHAASARKAIRAADDVSGDRIPEPRFRNPILRGVMSEYEAALSARDGAEVNTQAVIENFFNTRAKAVNIQEGFTRHSVSVMIVIGLLGTFIGLTISVQSLILLFRGYDVTELLSSVESGLLSALAGMSTAFTTSLFGIACSVVITIFNIFISPGQAREDLMVALEDYLDNTAPARYRAGRGDGYDKLDGLLRNTFIDFGERIADRFDRSLLMIRDDVRGIEEVNNNLRNTIGQLDVSFTRIADAIKASTRHIDENYQSLANLSDRFMEMNEELANVRKENAFYSKSLVGGVSDAAQAITSLTADLRGEAQQRLDNFQTYNNVIMQMSNSAELIRTAVAAIPDQMYAYTEGLKLPQRGMGAGGAGGVGAGAGGTAYAGAGYPVNNAAPAADANNFLGAVDQNRGNQQ